MMRISLYYTDFDFDNFTNDDLKCPFSFSRFPGFLAEKGGSSRFSRSVHTGFQGFQGHEYTLALALFSNAFGDAHSKKQ